MRAGSTAPAAPVEAPSGQQTAATLIPYACLVPPTRPLNKPPTKPRAPLPGTPQVLLAMLREEPAYPLATQLAAAQDALVAYCLAAGVVHRIAAALTLFDRPQVQSTGGMDAGARHCPVTHAAHYVLPVGST